MRKYPTNWNSWTELTDQERRNALGDVSFWANLTERQRQSFVDDADWQELRHVSEAKQAKLDSLVTLDEICQHLGLSAVQVYWLMSTRKLAGAFLVGGAWKFDRKKVDQWVERSGGIDAVRKDVEAQIEKHRAAQQAPAH